MIVQKKLAKARRLIE